LLIVFTRDHGSPAVFFVEPNSCFMMINKLEFMSRYIIKLLRNLLIYRDIRDKNHIKLDVSSLINKFFNLLVDLIIIAISNIKKRKLFYHKSTPSYKLPNGSMQTKKRKRVTIMYSEKEMNQIHNGYPFPL